MKNTHLSYRTSNPALNKHTFKSTVKNNSLLLDNTMTIEGTVNKTALSLFLLVAAGYYTFSLGSEGFHWVMIGGIGGFIVAIVTMFKRQWSPITVPIYAILEGLMLGSVSFIYGQMYDGLVFQAICLTIFILFSLLFAYRSKIIKPTQNFKLGLFAATGGVFLLYLFSFIASFFGVSVSILDPTNSSLFSIGASLLIVVIASLNLVIDFDFIEEGAEMGVPKYMEWYGAFGLLVTLVWLYLEILRMLAKLRNR